MKKSIITLLILFATLATVSAQNKVLIDGLYYNLDDINRTAIVTYMYYSSSSNSSYVKGDISIPSSVTYSGTTYSVTGIGREAFRYCNLTNITIPNSITSIDSEAFMDCNQLTHITIPNSVTYLGDWCFMYCSRLASVTIGNSVQSIKTQTFLGCDSLVFVTIGNSVTKIEGNAFGNCGKLTNITIPISVTSISGNPFENCENLVSINVDENNNHYSSLDGVWYNKDKTELVIYPPGKADTPTIPDGVKRIGNSAFSSCNKLSSINIPYSVTSIGNYAFSDCRNLTTINIPNSVTSIGTNAFLGILNVIYSGSASGSPWGAKAVNGYVDGVLIFTDNTKTKILGCFQNATEVTIPNTVITIGAEAFMDCDSLKNIIIPNSVTTIEKQAFYSCDRLSSVTIGSNVRTIGESAFSYSAITSVDIPNNVTSLGSSIFRVCSHLTSVTIGDGLTEIPYQCFYGCDKLANIPIGNNVISIGERAFSDCAITSITIPENVTTVKSGAFNGCRKLESIIWNAINCMDNTGDGKIFYPTSQITTFIIGDKVEHLPDYLCNGMSSLTSIVIPESVKSVGYGVFKGCTGLPVEDNIRYADTYLVCAVDKTLSTYIIKENTKWIGTEAFEDCSELTSLIIPQNVLEIGNGAFYKCNKLGNIIIPNNVTTVGKMAFSNCSIINAVTIGKNVEMLGSFVFENCTALTSIIALPLNPPTIYSSTFSNISPNATVYFPFGDSFSKTEAYKAAEYWKDLNIVGPEIKIEETILSPTSYSITFNVPSTELVSCGIEGDEPIYGNVLEYIGLEPNSEYADIPVILTDTAGLTETVSISFTTSALELTTEPSQAVSTNTALLFAKTNMSEAETSCGFEWKRNDAPDNMAGTMVYCPVAAGTMAGRLKNLNENVYYKYRAFYKSAVGNTYYGDWQYIFTGDATVEFDPVLYTYTATRTTENSATISGYALAGSEDFTEQGFEYWAESRNTRSNIPARKETVIGEHYTIEVSGISMRVTLTGLDAGTVYKYRAYAKVGDMVYYGSEQSFTTQGIYTLPTYLIQFVDWDGTLLQSSDVEEGDMPEYTGTTPTRTEDEQYKYTFQGWTPTLVPATTNATYTAFYSQTQKSSNGINDLNTVNQSADKLLYNGHLYIRRNGKVYTITGAEIK